jgi:transcriptional regulator with XRE-family HTH domain
MLTSQKITEIRKSKGMSMVELSTKTGITQASISRYESGKIRKINSENLAKIAEALEVSVEDLTEGDSAYTAELRPYERQKELTSVQDEDDEKMLFAFHMLPKEAKSSVIQICHIIAERTA